MSNIVKELHYIQDGFEKQMSEYEECIKKHEGNAEKYKEERENLARRIKEQAKELDMLQQHLDRRKLAESNSGNQDAERIVVHVNSDGSYRKNVEKVSPSELNHTSKPNARQTQAKKR